MLRVLIQDRVGRMGKPCQSRESLEAAINWLCRAQDVCGCGGVSAGYSFVHGWHPPYPETTGSIIPTFYDFAHLTRKEEIFERARRMADWELEVQLPSGAVQGSVYRGPHAKRRPVVFNTGQVILGWLRAFVETTDERYLNAARRAGAWLIAVQSPDGAWRLAGPEVETQVHSYDSRTAWSLLEIEAITGERRYADAARLNLEWTLAQRQENGWFDNNAYFVKRNWTLPLTHTIAHAIEGLFESCRLTGEERYLEAAHKTAEKLMRIFELRRCMAGEFDRHWTSPAKYSCLSGNAQIAGLWLKLFEVAGDARFLDAALKLNDFVKASQNPASLHPGVRGGVKGSQPIFGRYTPLTYVNWGAKFLADSLMLEEYVMADVEENARPGKPPATYEAEAKA
ncbi:MAG: prenyltransferase/squalene oxidase repeat-containing protein, partial [Blastocatellia bacterium]